MITIFEGFVAGTQHSDYKKLDMSTLNIGDTIKLMWSPSNKFDRNAIKVIHNMSGIRIGWIPKEFTSIIHLYRTLNIPVQASLLDFNPDNTPWTMFRILIEIGNEPEDIEI